MIRLVSIALLAALALAPVETAEKGTPAYFPDGIWSRSDEFRREWYSRHLQALGEPSLVETAGRTDVETYRFVWLRTFHPPVAVRITLDDNAALIVRSTDGAGGYDPGRLVVYEWRALTAGEVGGIHEALDAMSFWRQPTELSRGGGLDGAQWIVEGVKEGRYHLVDRWSPESGEVREFCLLLLRLSGLDVDEIY